jgi:hypothetical protein
VASDIEELVRRAGILFIYPSTVIRFVSDPNFLPQSQLKIILSSLPRERDSTSSYVMLDDLYMQLLYSVVKAGGKRIVYKGQGTSLQDMDLVDADLCYRLRISLGSILLLRDPVSESALLDLIHGEDKDAMRVAIRALRPVLLLPDDQPIRILHPSFAEFLLDNKRCRDMRLQINQGERHLHLALGCLTVMNKHLHRDICRIKDTRLLNSEVVDLPDRICRCIPPAVQYACMHWVTHLAGAAAQSLWPQGQTWLQQLKQQLLIFSTTHLLHWMEVTSLLRAFHSSFSGYRDAIIWCEVRYFYNLTSGANLTRHEKNVCTDNRIVNMLRDAECVADRFGDVVAISALQVYDSLMTFIPNCDTHDRVEDFSETCRLVSRREAGWDEHRLRTLAVHKGPVNCVAFSQDGSRIVSGSGDNVVCVWDANTGEAISTLKGHTKEVYSVALSQDGERVVSGSWDNTVRIWNTNTGEVLKTLGGHTSWVGSVAFSQDGTRIVSSSMDDTVRIWDVKTGATVQILKGGDTRGTFSVAFSQDDTQLILTDRRGDTWTRTAPDDFPFPAHILADRAQLPAQPMSIFAFDHRSGWLMGTRDTGSSTPRRICWVPVHLRPYERFLWGDAFAFSGSRVVMGARHGAVTVVDCDICNPLVFGR